MSVLMASTIEKDNYENDDEIGKYVVDLLESFFFKKTGIVQVNEVFKPGMHIVIKPNLVHEMNFRVRFEHEKMERPNDCFITNWALIKGIVKYLSKADGLNIIILECPLQSCDISKIIDEKKVNELRDYNRCNHIEFIDGRRTKYIFGEKEPTIAHNLRDESHYIDIDLGNSSEHIEFDKNVDRFRVTDYPPSEMKKFHSKGVHVYRIAKEILEADVVFSVPKLKTHMKAGMTCAMKNFVGIVGNKECLPHHTKGNPYNGGDCYGNRSIIKAIVENKLDRANEYLLSDEKEYYRRLKGVNLLLRICRLMCLDSEVTGSWYGNDTISRTIVDLNRIAYYGGIDGRMHNEPQRQIISFVDALVSGQGNGPMSPIPNYTKFFAVSDSTALADIFCAEYIGLDSEKIHYLYSDRICRAPYPIIDKDVEIIVDGKRTLLDEIKEKKALIVSPHRWEGKIEKLSCKEFTYHKQVLTDFKQYPERVKKYLKNLRKNK